MLIKTLSANLMHNGKPYTVTAHRRRLDGGDHLAIVVDGPRTHRLRFAKRHKFGTGLLWDAIKALDVKGNG